MGTINLEASDDNGISWASIWRSTGNLGDSWLTANIDLVAYVGSNVQLRFNRVTGSTWEADIAIDNINLSNGMATRETTVITTEVEVEVEVLHIKDITLYPNPVKGGLLNIKSTYTNISFEIYNMVGQLVSKGKVKNKAINVSNLNEGIYQIRFSSEGKTITKRFIKQ
jgi:bacillopeptidase F (M6 metalloprotease family)